MLNYESLREGFPFPEIRPVQEEGLQKIAKTLQEGKRFTVLEMPVGAGKSPLAIAVGRAASQVSEGVYQPGAHITTTQIILQQQYMRDFESFGLREIKGKSNYMCCSYDGGGVVDCGTSQALHTEEEQCTSCTYKLAREAYLDSPLGITNFAYFTTIRKTGREEIMPSRMFLVVDEAHNVESALIGFGEVSITESRISLLDLDRVMVLDPKDTYEAKLLKARDWVGGVVLPAAKSKAREFLAQAKKSSSRESAVKLVKMSEGLGQFVSKIQTFLESGPDEPWVVYNQVSPHGITESLILKPLYANRLAEKHLFSAGRYVLMMSGTILGPRVFAKNLGIAIEDLGFKRFDSDFPVESRLVHFEPVGSMSFKNIDQTLPKMAAAVVNVARRYPTSKGIVHTNSYKVTKAIVEALNKAGMSQRVLSHSQEKGSRDQAVARHINTPEPTILVSPSMTEGLDLVGDLGRWQIITKTPYPSLGDEWIKTRLSLDQEWYQLQATLTIIQASGRCVRSREDHADTFILDSDFGKLLNQAGHLFPGWWKQALVGVEA